MSRQSGVLGALGISLGLHLVLLWLWFSQAPAPPPSEPLQLQLAAGPQEPSSPKGDPLAQEAFETPSPLLPALPDTKAQPRRSVRDAAQTERLRRIRMRIARQWEATVTPGPGQVVVQLNIGPQGRLHEVRVPLCSGPAGLESVVREVVARGAPYTEAMQGTNASVWVECEFMTGGSGPETAPARTPAP